MLSADTWTAAARDIRSGRIDLSSHTAFRQPYSELTGIPLGIRLALAAALAIAAAWFGTRCRRSLRAAIERRSTPAGSARSLLALAFVRDLLDIAVPAAVLLVALACLSFLTADLPLVAALSEQIILAGLAIIFARWLGQSIFRPAFPPAQLVDVAEGQSGAAILAMTMLGVAMAADQLVDYLDQQPGASATIIALMNCFIVIVTACLMWWLVRLLKGATQVVHTSDRPPTARSGVARATDLVPPAARLLTIAAVFGLVAAVAGYVPLARYVVTSTIGALAVIATAMFLYSSLTEASELLFHDRKDTGSRYLQLLPLAFGFVLFLTTVPIVAVIWGVSAEKIVDWILALKNGIAVGQIQVSFGSVMTFAIVFLLGYAVTRWLQRMLHFTVLDRLRIEAGARAAVLTGFGYLGLTLSALVAITAAGLDLSSLAYIAGALSVGVGFGLQSVVANFVSGIILLIERPIKVGDWIELGSYSGHVRRIAFRSTHIETFDRHEVIIPNSDLISGSVTNLTYGGSMGRITLPVGIAYGSDVELARTILLGVLTANERVLDDPAPSVIMESLGDSAINLQALCFVANVNQRLSVRSDLYFAILAALQQAGIGIPFPQREIWLRPQSGGRTDPEPTAS